MKNRIVWRLSECGVVACQNWTTWWVSTIAVDNLGWAVETRGPLVDPNPIALTAFNATQAPFRITANFRPVDYQASPLLLQLLDDDQVLAEVSSSTGTAATFTEVQRGFVIEPNHHYTARTILNEVTPFRMESATTELSFGLGILGGYGMVASPDGALLTNAQIAALVSGQSPQRLRVSAIVDLANRYGCFTAQQLAYVLVQSADVSLKFFRLGEDGATTGTIPAWFPLNAEHKAAGTYTVDVDAIKLPPGEYSFELTVRTADGRTETRMGRASSEFERMDSLPLGHSLVKGVDTYSGGASLSEIDIDVGGRGPGLHLSRTYSSHQGNQSGVLGDGWSTNLDAKVIVTACGERIVTGSVGQGMAFAPTPSSADGAQVYKALFGYHATLVQRGSSYDLYGKDGTHQRFDQPSATGVRLTSVTDPNGNVVVYTWDVQDSVPRVTRVQDSAGRQIDLDYGLVSFVRNYGPYSMRDTHLRLKAAKGPLGLRVYYVYDSEGNLQRVSRTDGSGGDRVQEYSYRDYGSGGFAAPGTGPAEGTQRRFGFRLEQARNALNGATRKYEYELGWYISEIGGHVQYVPEQRVKKVTEPDLGETRFAYELVHGPAPTLTRVTDALAHTTDYVLNSYGAAERVTHPTIEAGTAADLTEWDWVHYQPHKVTDPLNTTTTYTYDDAGNKTSEIIVHPTGGTLSRNWTYKPAGDFESPYIRDRVATVRDGRGILTEFAYDAHGNRTETRRGGVVEHDSFAPNGDRISHTDGARKAWLYRYDQYGTLKEAEDPLRNVLFSEFDARGRQISETDANGAKTTTTYDAQDRVRSLTHPATQAGTEVETTIYDDTQDLATHTDADGVTSTQRDWAGRVVMEQKDDGTRRHKFDKAGNLTEETDFAGHLTTYLYDNDNHRTRKDEPEGRRTDYKPDLMGHVVSEIVSDRGDAAVETRETRYFYDHPLYARTSVQRLLRGMNGDKWLEELSIVDGNGNVTRRVDPLGRGTDFVYDDRDRLHIETAPLGRVITTAFDDADRKVREARSNPAGSGEQVRQWLYDDAGRLTETIDATDAHRTQGFDPAGNVIRRTDALGHPTTYTYDARHHLLTETGPEAGQLTTYHYDLHGNRTGEDWPNGRHLVTAYDTLHRPKERRDELGVVEKLTYLADNEVRTRTDAVGAITTQFYDGLHRPYRTELPEVDGMARAIVRHYTVHGDVLYETDPGNHTTSYTYDSLGRRTGTTLPEVDGQSDTLTTTYDDAGNVLTQTDARHATTTYVVNALNQRTSQTDPADGEGHVYNQIWTYDRVGNVLAHTDRRNIVTVTSYDKENRPTGVMRDNLLLSRTEYDDQGNVARLFDALNHRTDFAYDKANRKLREDRSFSARACGDDGCGENEGATRRWTYTPLGDIASETDADGRTSLHEYTLRRYAQSDTNAAHEKTTYEVDGEGRRLTIQRPGADATTLWRMTYDAAGQLRSVTDPLTHVTTYGYDVDGRRTTIEDARHNVTTFGYDERHRLRKKTYPTTAGAAVHTWHYDANNNLDVETTPNGRVLTSTYDALNRRRDLTIAAVNGTPDEAATHWRYDGNGNVLSIEEARGSVTQTDTRRYDPFDRLEHRVTTDGGPLSYGYDDVGNRTRLTDADGTTTWTYDALNRNTAVIVPGQGTTMLDYYPSGLPKTTTRPDGSTSTTTYDDAGRVEAIAHAKAGSAIASLHYEYYSNGNRREQRETNGPVTQNTEQKTSYVYDTADRLTDVTEHAAGGTAERHTHYILDEVGNRTDEAVTLDGTPVSHSTLQYNQRDQLTQRDDPIANVHVTQTYDADGNLATQTSNGLQRVSTYDARDRLVTLAMPNAPPNALLTFDYDSTGLRTKKQTQSTETRYRYDGQSLLAETNALGNTLSRYHYSASALISRTEAGSTPTYRHYLLDALKTPIALLTQDGAVSSRTRTDAWGEVIAQLGTNSSLVTPNREQANAELPSSDGQPIGYTGYLKDSESGLYYAKARYYDPAVARFTTEDPEAGEDLTPPSLHRYLYAYANPTVWVDRNGQTAELAAINLMLSVERQDSLDAFTAAKRQARARAWYDLPGKALSGAEMLLHGGSVVALAAGEGVFGGANLIANTVIAGVDKLGASEYVLGLEEAASQSNGELNEMFEEVFPVVLAAQENPGETLLKAGDAAYDGTIGVAERAITRDDSQAQIDLAQMANPMKFAKRVMNAVGGKKRIVVGAFGEHGGSKLPDREVATESQSSELALKPPATAATTDSGIEYTLKRPPGVTDVQWQKKLDALNAGAAEGRAKVVHHPVRSGAAQRQARAEGRIAPGDEADHGLDLQFGGRDVPEEIISTNKTVNRSVGGQGRERLRHPDGTPIKCFKEDCQ